MKVKIRPYQVSGMVNNQESIINFFQDLAQWARME